MVFEDFFNKLNKYDKLNIVSFIVLLFAVLFFIEGCATKVKYQEVPKPAPKLQTVDFNELNLSKDEPIKLHIKIKTKKVDQ